MTGPAAAALLLVAGVSACREPGAQPAEGGGPPPSIPSLPASADGSSSTADGATADKTGSDGDRGASHRRAPAARWASWPMPNFVSSGLPNPQSYDLGGTGTVIDNVTGLMWQRSVRPGNLTWQGARDACDHLELAGYDDWRLPSRIELVSILNMAETEPSIDRTAFPSTPADWFWSSSVAAESPTAAWYVYFYFGYPKAEEQSSPFRVRCVRTATPPPDAGDAGSHYDVRTASVRDRGTGLTWQRALSPRSFAFHAAVDYCGQLNLDGHKDWRVPSMPELETLIDEGASTPAIDGTPFPGTPSDSFWTSSLFGNKSAEAWYVMFDHGQALYGLLKAARRVRCVR